MITKRSLAIKLSKLKIPKIREAGLEQYETEGEIASEILWLANMNGDIENKKVADLGCGNGIFGVGCLLVGAKKVYFVDSDRRMIELARENSDNRGEYVCADVSEFNERVDTVVMNPPFGVQKRKADKIFLETAMKIARSVYSIHKIESKDFIDKIARKYGFGVASIRRFDMLLKKRYNFHKKDRYFVDVGCWHLKKNVVR